MKVDSIYEIKGTHLGGRFNVEKRYIERCKIVQNFLTYIIGWILVPASH